MPFDLYIQIHNTVYYSFGDEARRLNPQLSGTRCVSAQISQTLVEPSATSSCQSITNGMFRVVYTSIYKVLTSK